MGLDITAASKLVDAGPEPQDDDFWDDNWGDYFLAFAYDSLRHSTLGLTLGNVYKVTSETKTHGFRAGSYGGYNRWREDLAAFAGFTLDQYWEAPDTGQPFYELIHFADNEGSIGPEAAKNLLEDFRTHQDAYVLAHAGPKSEYIELYDDWIIACELAADGGLISFH